MGREWSHGPRVDDGASLVGAAAPATDVTAALRRRTGEVTLCVHAPLRSVANVESGAQGG
jgi:hypothetical protein